MSFFGLEQSSDLEIEKRKFLERAARQEDVAVYTWGEESYDGLGDALQEGGDELNDETFGGAGDIGASLLAYYSVLCTTLLLGKDFDFSGAALLDHQKPVASYTDRPLHAGFSQQQQPQVLPKTQTPVLIESRTVIIIVISLWLSHSAHSPRIAARRNMGQQISLLRPPSQQWY